jgi:drug/metabolite transporter (DMT)-like permease
MKKSPGLSAPLYMIISALSFALMSVAVKQANSIPLIQKVFFRNLVMLLLIVPQLVTKARLHGSRAFWGNRKNRGWLLVRSLFGFLGVFLYYFSIGKLTLADSAMLNKLSAFFVIILSALFLKERIRIYQIPALIAAFTGAMLIIKPGFNLLILPALAGFATSILAACAYTIVASLKGKEDPLTIIFWFSAVSTLASLFPMMILWEAPDLSGIVVLILTGIFAAGGQYFLTMAYTHGPAGEVSIYHYTQVVFSLIIGFLIWREIPDFLSMGGALLIIGAAIFLYFKRRRIVVTEI